ncbi:hypothetical protein GCM10010211_80740 [Streptomyces albospinus]|uniref:Uncharacterized protein n=1 Tax=Streptomyces albospinus TaxID=285515 RepID=A0ABQ2VNT3_9ACTN|nr:hypothetical protein GCM10010211_80740 [Streptomyces albospinus]
MKSLELKEPDGFLPARALEHDSPSLLFRLGCDYLRSAKVIRPGAVTLLEKVGTARQAAQPAQGARRCSACARPSSADQSGEGEYPPFP